MRDVAVKISREAIVDEPGSAEIPPSVQVVSVAGASATTRPGASVSVADQSSLLARSAEFVTVKVSREVPVTGSIGANALSSRGVTSRMRKLSNA